MSEFEYNYLSPAELYIADINEKSPAFNFTSGKSYFVGLKLPDFKASYTLTIKSFALGDTIAQSHIFFPKVLLLDDEFKVRNEDMQYSFNVAKASMAETTKENAWGLPIKLEGPILVDNPAIKYVVILTTDALLTGSIPYDTLQVAPIILPGIVTAIPTHVETIKIPHSPFGRITMKIDH